MRQMRNVFEAILKYGHDEDFVPDEKDDFIRPKHRPAPRKSWRFWAQRVALGVPLWHPEDRPDYSGLTGEVRPPRIIGRSARSAADDLILIHIVGAFRPTMFSQPLRVICAVQPDFRCGGGERNGAARKPPHRMHPDCKSNCTRPRSSRCSLGSVGHARRSLTDRPHAALAAWQGLIGRGSGARRGGPRHRPALDAQSHAVAREPHDGHHNRVAESDPLLLARDNTSISPSLMDK